MDFGSPVFENLITDLLEKDRATVSFLFEAETLHALRERLEEKMTEGDLRRAERRGNGILGEIRRLQLLLR